MAEKIIQTEDEFYTIKLNSPDGHLKWYQFEILESQAGHEELVLLLNGTYGWRGVWEGRIYFTQDEYWGTTLIDLAKIYKETITPICQKFYIDKEESAYARKLMEEDDE